MKCEKRYCVELSPANIVTGVITYYNTIDGVILSQSDGTDTMYFQYAANGAPFGLIFNGKQYFYLTNQMGDIVGLAQYQ